MNESVWPNEKNFTKLKPEEAKFILDQAEKQLKETSDAGNLVVSRATTLIPIVSGLIIGLTGFYLNRWQEGKNSGALSITALFGVVYLLATLIMLVTNIIGRDYSIIGSEPKALFVDLFFITKSEHRLTHFYVSEFVNYQLGITKNKNTNSKRWKWFTVSLLLVASTPIILSLVYLIINHLQRH